MPTASTSKVPNEELQLLARAVEGDTFHFVVAQWNHFSLIQQAKEYLRQQFPERGATSLRVEGATYEQLMDQIYAQGNGFVFIEDFENLLADSGLYVGFNQRRGKVARLPVSVVCFLPPGERYVELCIKHIPDWWSVLTFLAELEYTGEREELQPVFQESAPITTLGGTEEGRLSEITRLKSRIDEIEATPENAKLLNEQYRQLLELCETAGLYQMGLDQANQWLKVACDLNYENNAPDVFALILNIIGVFEQFLGRFDRAARLIEKALEIAVRNFAPAHPNVAIYQSNLATVYRSLGDYTRARDLLEAALASDLKNFGTEHPTVALNQSNLATVYESLGDFARARDLLESALASDLKNFGPDHPDIAVRQSNLATVYESLGDYARARDLLEAALASDLKNFGPNHPNIAVRQSNLSNAYQSLGDFARARDLLESALASDLKNFGPDHPNVAVRQSNLATVYRNMGDYAQAKDLLEMALASDMKNFGTDHPNVALRQSNLAIVDHSLGNYDRAKDLLESAITSDLKNFGTDHPNIANRMINLGAVHDSIGEKDKAKQLFQSAYDLLKKQLGEQHPTTQVAKEWLDKVS